MSETMSVRNLNKACACNRREPGQEPCRGAAAGGAGSAFQAGFSAGAIGFTAGTDTNVALNTRARWYGARPVESRQIGYNGELAEYLVPSLVRALGDPKPKAREEAARMLGEMRRSAADAVPALVKTLGDGSVEVRLAAAWALGEIGYGARQALDALVARMTDAGESREVRNAASEAVRKISLTMSCTS